MIYSYCLVVIVMGGRAGAPAMHVYHTLELKGKKKKVIPSRNTLVCQSHLFSCKT